MGGRESMRENLAKSPNTAHTHTHDIKKKKIMTVFPHRPHKKQKK